jgi:hypothetical protein
LTDAEAGIITPKNTFSGTEVTGARALLTRQELREEMIRELKERDAAAK